MRRTMPTYLQTFSAALWGRDRGAVEEETIAAATVVVAAAAAAVVVGETERGGCLSIRTVCPD